MAREPTGAATRISMTFLVTSSGKLIHRNKRFLLNAGGVTIGAFLTCIGTATRRSPANYDHPDTVTEIRTG